MSKKFIKEKITPKSIVITTIMFIVTAIFLIPIIWMISASFQGQGELFKIPFDWIPRDPSLDNYKFAVESGGIKDAFINSTITSILLIGIQVSLSTITGYVFCKYQFPYKKTIFMFIMMTLMIPGELTYFPLFEIVRGLNLTNTYLGLIFPFIYSGFGIVYIYQFSKYIPNEILEAAKIDGCGNLKTFFYVALPMLKSAISGLIILAFTFIWTEFAWSKTVVTEEGMRTLSMVLTQLSKGSDNVVNYGGLIAAGAMVMLPILIIFLVFQKNFIKSVAGSGVKG